MFNQSTNLFSSLANQYLKGEVEQEVITDPDIQRIVHGLLKKSQTTKMKVLNELKVILPLKEGSFYEEFTPTFINIYMRYVDNEYERRVLETSNQVLALICQHGKKSMQRKFKVLFPQWFMLINDYNTDVSESALAAFNIAFPKEKHGQAIQICTDNYINDLKIYMNITQEIIKQESLLEDEMVEHIYERLKVSAIRSIATAIQWNPLPGFIEQLMELLDFQNKKTIIIELLNIKKPRIVSAILETFNTLLTNETSQKFILLKQEQLLNKTLKLFEEKDRQIQTSLWKGFVINLFQKVQLDQLLKLKDLEQKTLELVAKAGFGVGKILYEKLIIFISLSPIFMCDKIDKEEQYRQRITSYKKILEAILLGLQNEEARFFADNLINSYFEALYFILCKRLLPQLHKYQNNINQLKNVVVSSIKTILSADNKQKQAYNYNPYRQVPLSIQQFFQMLTMQDENLIIIMNAVIEELKTIKQDQVELLQALLKVNDKSITYKAIQSYLQYTFDEIYQGNDINQCQILEIMPAMFQKDDAEKRITQIINELFQSIELIDPQGVLNKCVLVKKYCENVERILKIEIMDKILKMMIDNTFKESVNNQQILQQKQEQFVFKMKWICFFILSDKNTDPQYYLLNKDIEYQRIGKYINNNNNNNNNNKQQSTQLMNHLIHQTLQIQNMSIKQFIPSILNNEQVHNELIFERFNKIGLKAIQDKNLIIIFEEFAYLMHHIKKDSLIFEVILSLYNRQLSQKALQLISFLDKSYQEQFIQFFIQQKNKQNSDKYLIFLEDILNQLQIDHMLLVQQMNFNLQDKFLWNIFTILDCDKQYFNEQYQQENYQLIGVFLAINYSSLMMYDHKMKRFYQNFVSNNIKPLILDSFEAKEERFFKLIKYLFQQNEIPYGVALKHLIKQISLEEEELMLDKDKRLNNLIIEQICEDTTKLITIRQIINRIEINTVLPISQSLQQFINSKKLYYLDLATLGLQQTKDLLDLEDDQELDKIIKILFEQELSTNYDKMVTFDFINLITEHKTITPFASYIKEISNLFKNLFQSNIQLQKYYSFSIIAALQFVRKILNFIEAFPIEFLDYLNFELTDSLIHIIKYCNNENFMDEQNDTLFTEYAETLLRCMQLENWHQIDPQIYLELLQCPFISIQKAAYLAMKSTKQYEGIEKILNSVDLRRQIQNEDEDIVDVIQFPLESRILTYLLGWLIVEKKQKEYFDLYLNNLLIILEFLNNNGVMAKFSYKEIYQCDLDLMIIQDDQSELLKMVVISFYQFILAQQSYFKKWFNQDCTVGQKRLVEDLVQIVSKAIYVREVELIELNQNDWREDGFDIYAQKNCQEITASYQKEDSKIEIVIQVPNGYPLKALKLETKKGVKIGEDKLKRWSLMIRSILQNNNDTILSAIKLWKNNIDKQFQGLEECAICYYVIHSTGELPKMACRTCKHKFHSSCIQKWFQSSNKSDCPLCKSQFL